MTPANIADDFIMSIRDLSVEFRTELGVKQALHSVSVDMRRSRTTAVVGESGSGKSVMAYATMRLIERPGRITGGQIGFNPTGSEPLDILAIPPGSDDLYRLRGGQIAMIFQEPMTALSPVHTIGNQVMEAILTHRNVGKLEAFEIARRMLERVGIDNAATRMHQYPFEFSGGMRQRVVIAMALVCQPRVLICDEPTTALDVTVQAEILTLIRELKSAVDTSVLFITHDLGVVAQVADDVVVMYQGRVLETGPVRALLKDPLHPYTRALLNALPRSDRSARLATVTEAMRDFEAHPLVTLAGNRQVALPPEQIPSRLRS